MSGRSHPRLPSSTAETNGYGGAPLRSWWEVWMVNAYSRFSVCIFYMCILFSSLFREICHIHCFGVRPRGAGAGDSFEIWLKRCWSFPLISEMWSCDWMEQEHQGRSPLMKSTPKLTSQNSPDTCSLQVWGKAVDHIVYRSPLDLSLEVQKPHLSPDPPVSPTLSIISWLTSENQILKGWFWCSSWNITLSKRQLNFKWMLLPYQNFVTPFCVV